MTNIFRCLQYDKLTQDEKQIIPEFHTVPLVGALQKILPHMHNLVKGLNYMNGDILTVLSLSLLMIALF